MRVDGELLVQAGIRISSGQTGGCAYTMSRWEPNYCLSTNLMAQSFQSDTSGVLSLWPFNVPCFLSAGYLGLVKSISYVNPAASLQTNENLFAMGLYTREAGSSFSLLSLLTSGSFSMRWEISGGSSLKITAPYDTTPAGILYENRSSAGLGITSNYTGIKVINYPINTILTPGQYWLGLLATRQVTSFSNGIRVSLMMMADGPPRLSLSPIGGFSSTPGMTTGTMGSDRMRHFVEHGYGFLSSAGLTSIPNQLTLSDLVVGGVGVDDYVSGQPMLFLWSTNGSSAGSERLP